MKQFRPLIVAYLVSWSTEPFFAEIAIKSDSANFDYYGRYDFSNSSAAGSLYGYTISIKGIPSTSKKPIEMNKSYTSQDWIKLCYMNPKEQDALVKW
jgi:hypothetical protein